MLHPDLSEFVSFSGRLQGVGHTAEVTFRARVSKSGEVDFDFDPMQSADQIEFLSRSSNNTGPEPVLFSLIGKTEDGTELETSSLSFSSLVEKPVGSSSRTTFRWKLAAPVVNPLLRMHLKGFMYFGGRPVRCPLGAIVLAGATSLPDPDLLTGTITVQAEQAPADPSWRSKASELLKHVRLIMSLGAGAMLRAPIVEFWAGEDVEVTALLQTKQSLSPIPIFHFMRQQPALEAAVNSFFSPPIRAENLDLAIEWLAMETTYDEVRLLNAMTALENLLSANLTEEDNFLQPVDPGADETPDGKFEDETRPALQEVIRNCLKERQWSSAARGELYRKLGELNRRALLPKIDLLAERWSVPLDGLPRERNKAAKDARDDIVHRGHFREDDKGWEHVTVVREIVVRFVLTAIGYRGEYGCYIGAPHYARFPPEVSDDPSPETAAMERGESGGAA